MRRILLAIATLAPLGLTACDMLGLESATVVAARREAEGKAIGAGCRHAARPVEQCYALNRRAEKAAVFVGWKEMNDYMTENKIAAVPADAEPAPTAVAAAVAVAEPDEPAERKAPKGAVKATAKGATTKQ